MVIYKSKIKKLYLVFVLVFSFSVLSLHADKIPYKPKIKSTIVYPSRALVTRSTKIKLKKGKHILVFKDASPILDVKSLRAFSNNKESIIQGISSYLELQNKTANPHLLKLKEELSLQSSKASQLVDIYAGQSPLKQ